MLTRIVVLALLVTTVAAAPAAAAKKKHDARHASPAVKVSPDDLYRRRGYGQGGVVFGGRGGTAMAGACADVAFARPLPCEPGAGYGVYGNGLGYPFGF